MTAKVTKLKCVLLDADVIIEAHKLGIWQQLTKRLQLVVPSIVIHDEALFFSQTSRGPRENIRLQTLVEEGKIIELSATYAELVSIYTIFDRVFIETLHPGETEALALLKAKKVGAASFCTGDGHAIQALAMIGMSECGISMETLLVSIGLKRKLQRQFTEASFRLNRREGREKRITREGLAHSSLEENH